MNIIFIKREIAADLFIGNRFKGGLWKIQGYHFAERNSDRRQYAKSA